MKNTKKLLLILLPLLLLFSSSLIYNHNVRAVTVGDTSFGVNEGDVLTWVITQKNQIMTIPPISIGDKSEYTIDSISNLNNSSPTGFLIVNITLRIYNSTSGEWQVLYTTPISLIGFNATDEEFYPYTMSYPQFVKALPILPTPLNLTLMSEIITAMPDFSATPIGSNGLNCTYLGGAMYYTYNSNGIATTITEYWAGKVFYVMTLESKQDLNNISFGMSFLFFSSVTMIALAIIIKKRRRLSIT